MVNASTASQRRSWLWIGKRNKKIRSSRSYKNW